MKWLFLVNNAPFLSEFFGKLADEIIKRGDSCLIVWGCKIAEYKKKKFFPNGAKHISAIDWCIDNYREEKKEFFRLSWKDFFPLFDRIAASKFDYKKAIGLTLQAIQFFEFIFEKEKPNVIISESPTGLFHQVAYRFCEKNNVLYLGFADSKINNRIDIYDSGITCSKYERTFREINISREEKEFAESFVEKFISHQQTPSSMGFIKIHFGQFGLIKHYIKRIKESGPLLFRYFRERRRFKNFDYESEAILKKAISAPLRMERRQFRIFSQKNTFSKIRSQNKEFFLFPLQFQPEASTDVYAIYYCDQLNTIKNIAFSLPFPYKLCVKEHLAAIGTRPKEFYEKLKKIPNVVLVSPYENVESIVRNSSGVITLTSTVGLEAALAGKPVYILGDVFYSYHPLCRKVVGFEELKKKIEENLEGKPKINDLKDINNRFVASYFRNTILGDIVVASRKVDANDYKEMYNDIKRIFFEK